LQGIRAGKKIGQIMCRGTRHIKLNICLAEKELNKRRRREANFFKVRWQAYEAGEEICPGSRICPPGRDFESTNCVSWYKLKYVEEVSCHETFNYLQSG
jgi:hypothetical protein